ncbi:phage adaptor protein [Paraburkholderia antibiotica]|uniref:Uncharacterized protein n=1 Tax=Paraburkholderia antibiotica TaxID=2728839 RepID=A0A7Y0A0Z2_9BURK|nr:DUF6682 family protein [Paraburkholderia antibiotica]NML34515.1 hypothetical protein [Paraburkholderia antibiotica]
MIAGAIALEVAKLLSDAEPGHKFTRWTKAELIEYANDAALQITQLRALEFSQPHKLELVAGARQTLPAGGIFFSRVAGTYDAYGRVVGQPSATDSAATRIAANWFEPIVCRTPTRDYIVRSYSLDPDDQGAFYVDPPVPPGAKVEALVVYTAEPEAAGKDGALGVPGVYHNAVIEWMLYRAYSKDTESATDATRASEHLKLFTDLMGAAEQVYERYLKQVTSNAASH